MTEAELQKYVIEFIKYVRGILVYHTYDSRRSQKGFPDLTIAGPGGLIFRELKTARGKTTPEQDEWLATLQHSGQDAAIWRPEDWPDRITREIRRIA